MKMRQCILHKHNTLAAILFCLFISIVNNSKAVNKNHKNDSLKMKSLPFGSPFLANYKKPKYWGDLNDKTPNSATNYLNYYRIAARSENLRFHLNVKSIRSVIIDNDDYKGGIDLHYRYALPNFGPYQCYYAYSEILNKTSGNQAYIAIGRLFLYDVKTQTLNVINIYSEYVAEETTYTRCFLFKKNKIIEIFSAENMETEGSVKKIKEISISSTGKFFIKSFK